MVGRLRMWAATAALAAIAALGTSPPAHADFTLTLTDASTGATATFTGSGGAVATTSSAMTSSGGTVTFNPNGTVTIGNFTVNSSGTSSAPINNPGDVNQATVTATYNGTGSDTLKVTIQDNGFTGFGSGLNGTLNVGLSTTKVASGVTGTANAFYNDGSLTTTSSVSESGPISAPQGIGTGTSKNFTTGSGSTFTLGSELDIAVTGASSGIQSSFTVDANVVAPQPTSIVMALSALPIFGLGTWLRRRKMALLAA